MKHIFIIGAIIGLWCGGAYAAKTCNIVNTPMNTGQTYTYDASCYPGDGSTGGDDLLPIATSACDMCSAVSTTNNAGIVGVQSAGQVKGIFPSGGGLVTCTCSPGSVTYKCASGYYGTATSARAGCTVCPSNATCGGGNGSTFSCNAGYYKNGTACTKCSTATGHNSATSAAGVTAITGCYIPSGTTFSDSTGSGKYTSNCYYSN
ncbi:MAG: hypothetical protein NC311_02360 [Muribaculaceae bacterium]|nr:hypothetical protein [Muribaculaceae bacterium]